MNDKQIAFIMCVNNDQYCEECIRYINDLEIPEGYSIDVISIREATSITQGYNAAMRASDAKYKVYMHQDVFVVNKRFIYEMLEIFDGDEKIGMIGVLGTDKVPVHGEWYRAWTCGKVRSSNGKNDFWFINYDGEEPYKSVLAIDGMLMITQYDIPWREDVFDGWDMYDVSQSLEMHLAGYKVVVPRQENVWSYHDNGVLSMKKYDYYKELLLKEYQDLFKGIAIETEEHEIRTKCIVAAENMANTVKRLALKCCYKEIKEAIGSSYIVYHNNDLWTMVTLADIYIAEEEKGISLHSEWFYKDSWEEIYECYNEVRLVMIRIEHNMEDDRIKLLKKKVQIGTITEQAIRMMTDWLFEDSNKVKNVIFDIKHTGRKSMIEKLKGLVADGLWEDAKALAEKLFADGETSTEFWILYAAVNSAFGEKTLEHMCISLGLRKEPDNYELYFMLGNYYRDINVDQAYLCYEQALFYCHSEEDKVFIESVKDELYNTGTVSVHPTSIVILSYNICDILKGCVESIRENNPRSAYEVVVVDNASTDGVAEWIKTQPDIVSVCNKENKGYAVGCNQGVEIAAEVNDILFLNNDTIVPANALFWLRMGLYERGSVGAVGPMTNNAANNQVISKSFNTPQEYIEYSRTINVPSENPYENKVWLVGFAMLVKRKALKEVGAYDTLYEWGNYEDTDYGFKLLNAGYELLLCHNSFVYHYGSISTKKDMDKYRKYMRENLMRFIDKWKIDIREYLYPHMELINFISENADAPINILGIGRGCGATLAKVKYLYPYSSVCGFETDKEFMRFSTGVADVVLCDVEDNFLAYGEKQFDYILLHDVLEYLLEPCKVLRLIRRYLRPTGKVIVNVPNAMHITAILDLLKGKSIYKDNLLPNEKRKLAFTSKEIVQIFTEGGYNVSRIQAIVNNNSVMKSDENIAEAIYNLPGVADKIEFDACQYAIVACVAE